MSLTFEGDGTISGFDSGLSGFGGLVAVKSAIFTGTQTASVASTGNVAITDLSITHAVANAANKLIISAFIGTGGTSHGRSDIGLAVDDGTGLIAIGDAASTRARLTAGAVVYPAESTVAATSVAATFVHTPGDTSSKTYTLRAVNIRDATNTLYINRSQIDNTAAGRGVSSLVIQEVSV